MLLMMPILGPWLSLALQFVSDRASFAFKPAENGCSCSLACEWQGLLYFLACWKWLSLALQDVSDRACFVFKPAENGCPWLSSWWVTGLALFSSLLKMVVFGSSGGEWQGLLCFQACWKWLSFGSPVCEWQGLLSFQAYWKWLSLALQFVSDRACFVFMPAENGCPWLSRM